MGSYFQEDSCCTKQAKTGKLTLKDLGTTGSLVMTL